MFRKLVIIGLVLGLSGCAALRDRFGGSSGVADALPFKAERLRNDDPRLVEVAVRAPADATVDAMRESARYPATVYCLKAFGNSATDWVIDPATGDWQVTRSAADTAVFRGRCAAI